MQFHSVIGRQEKISASRKVAEARRVGEHQDSRRDLRVIEPASRRRRRRWWKRRKESAGSGSHPGDNARRDDHVTVGSRRLISGSSLPRDVLLRGYRLHGRRGGRRGCGERRRRNGADVTLLVVGSPSPRERSLGRTAVRWVIGRTSIIRGHFREHRGTPVDALGIAGIRRRPSARPRRDEPRAS